MKRGFDFIAKSPSVLDRLLQIEIESGIIFPERFKDFVKEYSISRNSIILEMKKDEVRGFEFPVEAVLFEPSKKDSNPLYFSSFRMIDDIADDLINTQENELWTSRGFVVIGYSTVGEKICLGVKGEFCDEIWRVNDDSIIEGKYKFLAKDIFQFIEGFVSKR